MQIKPGVDKSTLLLPALKVVPVVRQVFNEYGYTPRITSTNEHAPNRREDSFHPDGLAVDFGLWVWHEGEAMYIPTIIVKNIFLKIKKRLGYGYDVVLKSDHIHIERDIRNYP